MDTNTNTNTAPSTVQVMVERQAFIDQLTMVSRHAAKRVNLPMLEQVWFEVEQGQVVVAATDRYTLGVGRLVLAEVDGPTETRRFGVTVDGVKMLIAGVKRTPRHFTNIPVAINESTVTVGWDEDAVTAHMTSVTDYPPFRKLIPSDLGARDVGPMDRGFNLDYLARMGKSPKSWGAAVIRLNENHTKPAMVTYRECDDFVALIMPQRTNDLAPYAAPEWL